MAKAAKRLYICLDNAGYEVSLERYLYPSERFVPVELPLSTRRA
jgi:hypothetical protein